MSLSQERVQQQQTRSHLSHRLTGLLCEAELCAPDLT